MKIQTLKNIVALAFICAGMGLAPALNAAQFTNYLEVLQNAVAEWQSNPPVSLTAVQEKGLDSASSTLNKDSKTLSTDLKLLGSGSTVLDRVFINDEFTAAETESFDLFFADATAQLADVHTSADLIAGDLPKNVANSLAQADAAYEKAGTNDQGIASASRDLIFALNKIRVAEIQVSKVIKAPVSLEGESVAVTLREVDARQIKFTLDSDGTYSLQRAEGAPETGTWTYERTSANTGVITLDGGSGPYDVTFKNTTKGTFAGPDDSSGSISVNK
jgi:hypothetical protein